MLEINAAVRDALPSQVLSADLGMLYDPEGMGRSKDLTFLKSAGQTEVQAKQACLAAMEANSNGDLVLYLQLAKPVKGAAGAAASRPVGAGAAGGARTAAELAALRKPTEVSATELFNDGSELSVCYHQLKCTPAAADLPDDRLRRWALGATFSTVKWPNVETMPPPDELVLNGPDWPTHHDVTRLKLPPPGTARFSRTQVAPPAAASGGGIDTAALAAIVAAVQAPMMLQMQQQLQSAHGELHVTTVRMRAAAWCLHLVSAAGFSSPLGSFLSHSAAAPPPPAACLAPSAAYAVTMVAARTATIPGELSFSEGELLIVTAPPPGLDGWLDAKTMDGRAGRVPTSWSKRYTGACVCSATMVHYGSQVELYSPCSAAAATAAAAAAATVVTPGGAAAGGRPPWHGLGHWRKYYEPHWA